MYQCGQLPSVLDLLPSSPSSVPSYSSLRAAVSPLPPSPTQASNWLIPGRLVIGEHPSDQDATVLVQRGKGGAAVNTFVSLIGEYSAEQYRKNYYPRAVEKLLTSGSLEGSTRVQFLHYPIKDFAVTDGASLQPLVAELKRRLVADNNTVMYLHCRGGHGCVVLARCMIDATSFDLLRLVTVLYVYV